MLIQILRNARGPLQDLYQPYQADDWELANQPGDLPTSTPPDRHREYR